MTGKTTSPTSQEVYGIYILCNNLFQHLLLPIFILSGSRSCLMPLKGCSFSFATGCPVTDPGDMFLESRSQFLRTQATSPSSVSGLSPNQAWYAVTAKHRGQSSRWNYTPHNSSLKRYSKRTCPCHQVYFQISLCISQLALDDLLGQTHRRDVGRDSEHTSPEEQQHQRASGSGAGLLGSNPDSATYRLADPCLNSLCPCSSSVQ